LIRGNSIRPGRRRGAEARESSLCACWCGW